MEREGIQQQASSSLLSSHQSQSSETEPTTYSEEENKDSVEDQLQISDSDESRTDEETRIKEITDLLLVDVEEAVKGNSALPLDGNGNEPETEEASSLMDMEPNQHQLGSPGEEIDDKVSELLTQVEMIVDAVADLSSQSQSPAAELVEQVQEQIGRVAEMLGESVDLSNDKSEVTEQVTEMLDEDASAESLEVEVEVVQPTPSPRLVDIESENDVTPDLEENSEASDEADDEESEDRTQGELTLTGFLFGNIDTKTGKLENNYIFDDDDSDTEKQLKALEQLGVSSSILGDEERIFQTQNKKKKKIKFRLDSDDSDSDHSEEANDSDDSDGHSIQNVPSGEDFIDKLVAARRANLKRYDNEKKSPSAEDFFDMQELANEDDTENRSEAPTWDDNDTDYDNLDEENDDQRKMPPPSSFPSKRLQKPKQSSSSTSETSYPKKLETPLAAMLPSKYANIPVTTLFPDFRPDKVLRFSRLFGPGKSTSLPQIWKNVKKRRRKRALAESEHLDLTALNLGTLDKPMSTQKKDVYLEPASDDEEYYLRTNETENEEPSDETRKNQVDGKSSSVPPAIWRHGPASLWFDMLGVPEDATSFDYGFRALKSNSKESEEPEEPQATSNEKHFEDDAFHLATQSDWESAIIWDSQDAKVKKFSKSKIAGWVPSGVNRTAHSKTDSVIPSGKSGPLSFSTPPVQTSKSKKHHEPEEQVDDTWYSIFPVETEELVKYSWEDEIIWDVEKIDKIPEPKILALDPNDKNIILCMPDDIDPSSAQGHSAPVKVKIPHPHVKKSKILLGKAGVINVIEEDSPPPSPKKDDMDPYNISNDEYYAPKHTEQSLLKISASGNIIQHSTPVVELRAPFIPTHMGPMKLRNFHRPMLKKYSSGMMASLGPHPIYALTKHISKKTKQRENERLAAGGGDIFVWRTPEDISGKDGRLVLIEYCEEHPPLLSQVGMCSKLKNYFKRHAEKNIAPPELKLGETTYAHTSPYLGVMHPGELIQTIENNLYRAPIYEHPQIRSDFILIRTRSNFSIREYDHIFTAGQECPLYEVPGPNSKRANNFVRDFLQVFIYRLFWKSRDTPRRIRMDDIKRAFPMHSESSIRKRLKLCADFKRTGVDSNWWVIKPEFRLPTEEELRSLVSPEQCSAYFSLIAAEQRLKDAGYGEKFLFAPQDDDDEENQGKIDDEVKTAPWNTTRAYIQAMKGKCLLQLVGPADPTGIGEGFSYIRVPNKPQTTKEEQESQPKRIVTGTDADLRRLSLSNAKNLLRKFQVPEEEIQKLSRWEVIDVVRTLSTEKAKQGEKGIIKFSRGNRFSVAEHQERYKEECQRIFELQNKVLASSDPLTSDEEESNEEEEIDEDAIEEMGKNIENMLSNKKTTSQLVHEREEQERLELQKMIMGDGKDDKDGKHGKKGKSKESEEAKMEEDNKINKLTSVAGRVLKIHRKFKAPDGREYTRTETVRKPAVIDIYVRMRAMKDEAFIRSFTLLDDQAKEEMKKEKRRIQEQLRRIKRNQEKEHTKPVKVPVVKKKKIKLKPDLKMKCGACGQQGHMRTNKACPFYQGGSTSPVPPINVAMTEEQEEEIEKELVPEEGEELVKLDGTKVHLSSKVLKHAEEIKRRSLLLKVPRDAMSRKYKKRAREDGDYYRKERTTNRRRIDPRVMISNIFENILNEMKNEPDSNCFVAPVSQKTPRYYEIVKTPMDLQTMREKIRQRKYDCRTDFLTDSKLLVSNSILYNGEKHIVTAYAQKIYDIAEKKVEENASKLSRYEKLINPLLDDNYKKKLNYILSKIIDKAKVLPEASSFLKPVNKKTFKNYYEVIENPMDLDTMEKKIRDGLYNSRLDFVADLELIYTNSCQYNGATSSISEKASVLVEFVKKSLQPFDEHLKQLEVSIQKDDADKIEESDSEFGGSDTEDLTVGPLEGDDSQSTKFPKDESRSMSMVSESGVEFGDDEIEGKSQSKAKIQAKTGFSGALEIDKNLPPLTFEDTFNESRKRTREDSGSIGGWFSGSEAGSEIASKRSRTESLDTESQQAIEAMIQLSQSTSQQLIRQTDEANFGSVISSGIVEEYTSQSIHADLEVSDSDDSESSDG